MKGMGKIAVNPEKLAADLDSAYEVLAEPVQTVMRRYGVVDAYERLKAVTRGKAVTKESLQQMVDDCKEIPEKEREALKALSPSGYTGIAADLAKRFAASK